MNPEELLQSLRAVPPIGAWAVLGSEYDPDAGEWTPDGLRPSEWHHTRAQAEASASRQAVPTWIAKVVKVEGGWSTGEALGPYCEQAHADNLQGTLQNTSDPVPLISMEDQIKALEDAATEAWRALDMMAEEAEAEGDLQHAHWLRHRAEPLDRALSDLDWKRVESMNDEDLRADMIANGLDPDESFADFHDKIKRLCDEHRARSEANAATRRVSAEVEAGLDDEENPF